MLIFYVGRVCLGWLKCSNVWRKYQQTCRGNSLKTVCVVMEVFWGKLMKSYQGYFPPWKTPLLSIHFPWKIEDQTKSFSRVFSFKYNKDFFCKNNVSPSLHVLFYSLIKYMLGDRHCAIIIVTAVSMYIPFIMKLRKTDAPWWSIPYKKTVRLVLIVYSWGKWSLVRFWKWYS